MKIFLLFLFIFFGRSAFAEDAELKNIIVTNVDREIDISTQLIRETLKFEIENADKTVVKFFVHGIDPIFSKNVAYVDAYVSRKSLVFSP